MESYDPVVKVEMFALIDGAHPGIVVRLGCADIDKIINNFLEIKAGRIDHFHLQHPEFRPSFQGVIGEITFVGKEIPEKAH